jgi:excisionase family DNA binding protein
MNYEELPGKLLTIEQVASLLQVKPSTIRFGAQEKKVEVVRVGRLIRITEDSILRLVRENTVVPRS